MCREYMLKQIQDKLESASDADVESISGWCCSNLVKAERR